MKRLALGHFHNKLEVPRLTCPGQESNPVLYSGRRTLKKEPFEQLINNYSEDLHMSVRPIEDACDSSKVPTLKDDHENAKSKAGKL
jgi:hypothetical protein